MVDLPAAITATVSIVAGAALTLASAQLLGLLLLNVLLDPDRTLVRDLERVVFGLAVGSACLSSLVFLLCVLQVAYLSSFLLLSAAIALAYLRWGRRGGRRLTLRWDPGLDRLSLWLFTGIALAYGGICLVYALAPETSGDGIAYHLGLVRRYYNDHGFSHITTSIYAFLSQGTEMLYLFAYSIGRHSAAKLVHFSLLAGTVLAILCFGRRIQQPRAGFVAALLYLCAPVVGVDAATSYNDCALAFFVFVTFYALFLWVDQPSGRALVLLGILAGFCFAVKYTGGTALLGVTFALVWHGWKTKRRWSLIVRDTALVGATAAVFIVPWLVKNAVIADNPVAPLFNSWFPNPHVTVSWERDYRDGLKHFSGFAANDNWQEYLTAPLEVTTWGGKVQSILGPVFLLFPVGLLGWRRPVGRAALLAAVLIGAPWFANVGVRFLIPALPLAALAMAIGLASLPRRGAVWGSFGIVLAHALLSWPWLIASWHPDWIWRLEPPVPWRDALRLIPEEQHLEARIPTYRVARKIEAMASPGSRVLSLEQLPEAYMDTEVLVCYQAAPNERLFRALFTPQNQDFWPTRSLVVPLPNEPLAGFRIVQVNTHERAHWSLSEVILRNGETEVQLSSGRKLQAQPMPWDAGYAFDGDRFSWWDSGEPLRRGMRIQVEWPEPLRATEAELIFPKEQHFSRLAFEAKTPGGGWKPVRVETIEREVPVSQEALQRWAGMELRRANIDFLVTDVAGGGHNIVAPEIAKNPAAWGLREVFRDGSRRLYRVRPLTQE